MFDRVFTEEQHVDGRIPRHDVDPPSGDGHVDDITEILTGVTDRQSDYRVFTDWVDTILASLLGDETAYQDAIDGYSRAEVEDFAEAFARLYAVTMDYQVDVFGDVYEAMGVSSDSFGQEFTPHSVAELMGFLDGASEHYDADEAETVADPTCGSGRLLIAAARRTPDAVFVGQDKSEVCAKMVAINLWMFQLDGYVIHGDTLTLDVYQGWQVVADDGRAVIQTVGEDVLEGLLESFLE